MIRLTLATLALLATGMANAATVTVDLTGVQARGGTVYAALQGKADFMAKGGYAVKTDGTASGTVRLTFTDVAPGDYALSVLHDADGNRQMGLSAQGIPTEGWAMSRGETLRGKPTFDMVKLAVPADGLTTTARMVYSDGKVTR